MNKIVIASMCPGAGKTSLVVGLGQNMTRRFSYLKPLGDRLLYRKKRLWDYDAALIMNIFELGAKPEEITLGFEHAKLRYMYEPETIKARLLDSVNSVGKDKDLLLIETGKDLRYGASMYLDAISIAQYIEGKLILVVGGDEYAILDELVFLKKSIDLRGVTLGGVIINNVQDIEVFKDTHLKVISELGIQVLGIIPCHADLNHFTVNYLVERMFAKVIAGEAGLNAIVKNIFVGAMSATTALENPLFSKENKLIITSGDRSDMILAALERQSVGIIITNNMLPPANIISKAAAQNVPLLMVPSDTYETAKLIDNIEILLTKEDAKKIELLGQLVGTHVNIDALIA